VRGHRGLRSVPAPFPRWSFSLPEADFSNTTVTLASNGVPVALQIEPISEGAGEHSVVWHATGQDTSLPSTAPRPSADALYEVTLQNVILNGASRSFNYDVVVFDPDQPGSDTVVPAVQGAAQVAAGVPYTTPSTPCRSPRTNQRLRGRPESLTAVEGAESGLEAFVASTRPATTRSSPTSKPRGAAPSTSPTPRPTPTRSFTSQRMLIPLRPLNCASRSFSAPPPRRRPPGRGCRSMTVLSWTPIYTHPGSNGGG